MMRPFLCCAALLLALLFAGGCKKENIDKDDDGTPIDTTHNDTITNAWDTVRMNRIQTVASHNSFRKKTYLPLYDKVQSISNILPASLDPDGWDYDHLPLPEQFDDYNVRGIELDLYNDPTGGLFYNRQGLALISEPTASGLPALQQPGFKIIHIPDLDYMTNYLTFKSALQAIKTWSDAHPKHLPIVIYLETKTDGVPLPGYAVPVGFDAAAADALDQEIKDIFGDELDNVITPDDVRGSYATLKEAVLADKWPRLHDARGKVVFVIDGAAINPYTAGHPTLENRAMFVFASESDPYAAFIIRNDPEGNEAKITTLVKKGYIVRTRSDADTDEARTGDYSRMNAAFSSGAQVVSSDYYKPDANCGTVGSPFTTCFQVQLPGNILARVSPAFNNEHFPETPIEE